MTTFPGYRSKAGACVSRVRIVDDTFTNGKVSLTVVERCDSRANTCEGSETDAAQRPTFAWAVEGTEEGAFLKMFFPLSSKLDCVTPTRVSYSLEKIMQLSVARGGSSLGTSVLAK